MDLPLPAAGGNRELGEIFAEMGHEVVDHQRLRLGIQAQARAEVGRIHHEISAKSSETQAAMSRTYQQLSGMSYGSIGSWTGGAVGASTSGGPVSLASMSGMQTMSNSSYDTSSPLIQLCMQRGIQVSQLSVNDAPMLGMSQTQLIEEMRKLGIDPYRQGLNSYGGYYMR
ncbi:MAG: hypothetical protein AB1758_05545 [Candidatus Eremiobacterota bacterium]